MSQEPSRAQSVRIVEADLDLPAHQRAVVDLVDAYAADFMGNGTPLTAEVKRALVPGLARHPTTEIFLAYAGADPVGIAVCFRGFSTFAARPLINIHDLAVLPAHRGKGIGRMLLAVVERKARDTGCCKITLEVQENNHRARRVYEAAGLTQAEYMPGTGGSLFYSKALLDDNTNGGRRTRRQRRATAPCRATNPASGPCRGPETAGEARRTRRKDGRGS